MSRDSADYLRDMLEACDRIMKYTAGADRENLAADTRTIDALIRNLEVLGEAAKRVPEAVRAAAPAVPWRQVAGMRDVLIHDYFGVDEVIVLDAALEHVPRLRDEVARLMAELRLDV